MNKYYDDAWYDERWQSMPPELRKRAVGAIKKVVDEQTELVEKIKRKHAKHGHAWIHYLTDIPKEDLVSYRKVGMIGTQDTTWSEHMWWGMGIRNLLRSKEGANIQDEELPEAPYEDWSGEGVGPRNWDDVYCQAVEAAIGLREV